MNKQDLEAKLRELATTTNLNQGLLISGFYGYRIKKLYKANKERFNMNMTDKDFDLEKTNSEIYPVFERYIKKKYGVKT